MEAETGVNNWTVNFYLNQSKPFVSLKWQQKSPATTQSKRKDFLQEINLSLFSRSLLSMFQQQRPKPAPSVWTSTTGRQYPIVTPQNLWSNFFLHLPEPSTSSKTETLTSRPAIPEPLLAIMSLPEPSLEPEPDLCMVRTASATPKPIWAEASSDLLFPKNCTNTTYTHEPATFAPRMR